MEVYIYCEINSYILLETRILPIREHTYKEFSFNIDWAFYDYYEPWHLRHLLLDIYPDEVLKVAVDVFLFLLSPLRGTGGRVKYWFFSIKAVYIDDDVLTIENLLRKGCIRKGGNKIDVHCA